MFLSFETHFRIHCSFCGMQIRCNIIIIFHFFRMIRTVFKANNFSVTSVSLHHLYFQKCFRTCSSFKLLRQSTLKGSHKCACSYSPISFAGYTQYVEDGHPRPGQQSLMQSQPDYVEPNPVNTVVCMSNLPSYRYV